MIYPLLLTAALLCVWGTSAYMSVCGLLAVFGGHAVVTVALACGMELAKLMLIVELHGRWRRLGRTGRLFYILVIMALVAMTAIESIGYLIDSHTRDTATITVERTSLDGLKAEELALRQRIAVIDATVDQLPAGYVTRRIAERETAGYSRLQSELASNLAQQSALAVSVAKAETGASPILTIARLTGAAPSRVLVIFVICLVAIVEPLSIGLAVAASAAWTGRRAKHGAAGQTAAPAIGNRDSEPAEISAIQAASQTAETAETEVETAETAKAAETAAETAKIDGNAATVANSEFAAIVQRHGLKTADIATITGRKKFETVVSWLKGDQEIPEKALRELRRWSSEQPAIRLVKRPVGRRPEVAL
jgi:hypothetical protein